MSKIKSTKVVISTSFNPFLNLALEEYIYNNFAGDKVILYLWQNEQAVVVGRNQNPWQETRPELLKKSGCHLVRRQSGGGAVYHDTGNLNFTLLMSDEHYDEDRQFTFLQEALQGVGIKAQKSGRNDLLVKGKKISGSAFYRGQNQSYHHGTLLLDSNLENLRKYLQPSLAGLDVRGVKSVSSPVINLTEIEPSLTVSDLKKTLQKSLSRFYAPLKEVQEKNPENMTDNHKFKKLFNKYLARKWILGKTPSFKLKIEFNIPPEIKQIALRVEIKKGMVHQLNFLKGKKKLSPQNKKELKENLLGKYFSYCKLEKSLKNI
ncbi:MAG: lipoate--protein ligase family protein [bacterium]